MRTLLKFIVTNHFGILFFALEFIALVILVRNNDFHKASTMNIIQRVESSFLEKGFRIKKYANLLKENERLVSENLRLRDQVSNMNLLLIGVEDSIISSQFKFIPAKVINNSTNQQYNYITINKGENDSIFPGMGVISPDGVVGIVKSTSPNFAKVISLLNRDFILSSKLKNSENFGPVTWAGKNPMQAKLNEISFHVKPKIGDTVVTSGFSTKFPDNITVGYINEFNLEGGNYYDITLNLITDFTSLSNVYVIRNNSESEIKQLEESK